MRLGVDFGTSRTVVAVVDRGNYPVVAFEDSSGDACEHFPSVVAERAGELRFGFDAIAVADDASWTIVRSFKRYLADPQLLLDTPIAIGSITVPAVELVARFLAALRDAIRGRSNAPRAKKKDDDAWTTVVAVPAHAHGAWRLVTLEAFRIAGFAPIAMLNEPSAAGFEYTHRHRDTVTSRRDHVVVYDLGGGTFDASLVRLDGARHEVVATAGDPRLGGDDFDRILAELVTLKREIKVDRRSRARLLDACRDAKERLNASSRKVVVDLDGEETVIPVADYYAACAPLVERTIDAMLPVISRSESKSADSSSGSDGLDELAGIYVVGGASELPVVARTLRERFGRRVHRSPYPSAAVAIGLAIAADERAGFVLADRFTGTFGVFREGDAGRVVTFDPIFTDDTLLPARGEGARRLDRTYRAAHNVGHFRFAEVRGAGANAILSGEGRPRGDLVLFGEVRFPFDRALEESDDLARVAVERLRGEGPEVRESYALDEHGIVEVTFANVSAGYEQTFRFGAKEKKSKSKKR